MAIVGIGIDLAEVDRVHRLAERRPDFLDRCFTPGELLAAGSGEERFRRLAARFAAKEATFKALDIRGGLGRWREVEVVRRDGRPVLVLHGRAEEALRRAGAVTLHLSFSHAKDAAAAVVVAER